MTSVGQIKSTISRHTHLKEGRRGGCSRENIEGNLHAQENGQADDSRVVCLPQEKRECVKVPTVELCMVRDRQNNNGQQHKVRLASMPLVNNHAPFGIFHVANIESEPVIQS